MEKKFSREVTIALLPPLLNRSESTNSNSLFLDLGDLTNSNFSLVKMHEESEETAFAFVNRVARTDFSKEIADLINSKSGELGFTKIVLVNYPMNVNQLEKLEKSLEIAGFSISRLIVTSLASFDILAAAKEENFLCPMCFKSYTRKSSLRQEGYLCPLDGKCFTVSYTDKFTDYLTTYYLQNSIEVIQNFVRNKDGMQRKILSLNVDSENGLAKNIRKALLSFADNA